MAMGKGPILPEPSRPSEPAAPSPIVERLFSHKTAALRAAVETLNEQRAEEDRRQRAEDERRLRVVPSPLPQESPRKVPHESPRKVPSYLQRRGKPDSTAVGAPEVDTGWTRREPPSAPAVAPAAHHAPMQPHGEERRTRWHSSDDTISPPSRRKLESTGDLTASDDDSSFNSRAPRKARAPKPSAPTAVIAPAPASLPAQPSIATGAAKAATDAAWAAAAWDSLAGEDEFNWLKVLTEKRGGAPF